MGSPEPPGMRWPSSTPDMSPEAPLDRAVISAYTELLTQSAPVIVAEVGCGAGRVTRHLQDAGLTMVGFDLSPRMAAVAKATHPHLPFAAAHAGALPVRSAALGGLIAWYSLINMPTES